MLDNQSLSEEPDDSLPLRTSVTLSVVPEREKLHRSLSKRTIALCASAFTGAIIGTMSAAGHQPAALNLPPQARHLGSVPIDTEHTVINTGSDIVHLRRIEDSFFSPFLSFGEDTHGYKTPFRVHEVRPAQLQQDPAHIEKIMESIMAESCSTKHLQMVGIVLSEEAVREAMCQVRPKLHMLIEGGSWQEARLIAEQMYHEAITQGQSLTDLSYVAGNEDAPVRIHTSMSETLVVETNIQRSIEVCVSLIIVLILAGWIGEGVRSDMREEKRQEELRNRRSRRQLPH